MSSAGKTPERTRLGEPLPNDLAGLSEAELAALRDEFSECAAYVYTNVSMNQAYTHPLQCRLGFPADAGADPSN